MRDWLLSLLAASALVGLIIWCVKIILLEFL